MNKKILQLAIPSIVSNITVPLLGLIDVAIVGHLGSASYIGAIAVGGMLFNIIYWLFGFLRMGTSGMTSQAFGKRDLKEVTRVLLRAVGVGLFIALCLLLLQYPIRKVAFLLIDATAEVRELATVYFSICVWGAPACTRVVWFCRVVYRHAEFPFPDVYSDYTKYSEYRGKPGFCLSVGYEDRGRGIGYADCPIRRTFYGFTALATLLRKIENSFSLAGDPGLDSYASFLSGK